MLLCSGYILLPRVARAFTPQGGPQKGTVTPRWGTGEGVGPGPTVHGCIRQVHNISGQGPSRMREDICPLPKPPVRPASSLPPCSNPAAHLHPSPFTLLLCVCFSPGDQGSCNPLLRAGLQQRSGHGPPVPPRAPESQRTPRTHRDPKQVAG